jgi:hypothetical protein
LPARLSTPLLAALCGCLLFWFALHCDGLDWYICQTHADILYTGVWRFHELPSFSFVFHGGSYFLQDPQGSLLSPGALFVILAGPSVGVRLTMLFWGALGTWAFTAWMRRHVDEAAARAGALAWVLGLGVMWRIAVGNEMFLWHLGLPLFLLGIEEAVRAPRAAAALGLGLVGGFFLLGPSFHSITYVLIPALPVFLAVELLARRPDRRALLRTLACLAGAAGLALVIASPKLVAFARLALSRPIHDDHVIGVVDAFRGLFDYTAVHAKRIFTVGPPVVGGKTWGTWEVAVAPPPPALLLALLGAFFAGRRTDRRRLGALAAALLGVALVLTCWQPAWTMFRHLTGDSFRVSPRFLSVGAFALAILAAIGGDALRGWRLGRHALTGLMALMVASCVLWVRAAEALPKTSVNETVSAEAMNPFSRFADERRRALAIGWFRDLVTLLRERRDLLDGHGFSDGFLVVGDPQSGLPWINGPIVEGLPDEAVRVQHTRIELDHIAPGAEVKLRLVWPRLGLHVSTEPSWVPIRFYGDHNGMTLVNDGDEPIDVVITPNPLVGGGWFALSAAAVLGSLGGLVWLRRRRAPAR